MLIPTQKQGKTSNGHSNQTHCQRGHVFDEINTYIAPKSKKRSCKTCEAVRKLTIRQTDLEGERLKGRLHMREWRKANIAKDHRNWTENRKQKKAWVTAQKTACTKCSESDPVCLDFHHRDPTQKVLEISLAIASWSIKRIQAEIDKCDLLCSNCHRKLHAATTSS